MSNRGAAWWRGYWEQALNGGDTVVNIRAFDAALRDMRAELESAERRVEKLEAEVKRLSGPPAFLDEALNSGDGSCKP